ncbi:MAG: DUF6709 family protein [Lawsonibacter sp.]|nr:DUF6709 family protein [Lawsonibacter sp.]
MAFKVLFPTSLSPQELKTDFQQARDLGKVRLGQSGCYFTRFAGTVCLPWGQILQAWLRQEEVNANLCCGRANFDQFFLMVRDRSGTVHKGEVLSKELGKEALALISERDPEVEIGYQKERQPAQSRSAM